jgi:hypothetical protein
MWLLPKKLIMLLLAVFWLYGPALFAQTSDSAAESAPAGPSREARLMREVDARMGGGDSIDTSRHQALPIDTAATADSSNPGRYRQTLRAIKDSVLVLTRRGTSDLLQSFSGQKRTSRERGYGGGLGFSMGAYAIDVRPVNELIAANPQLSGIGFDINPSFEIFVLTGGLGYGGLGNGIRIGGGGYGGSRSFTQIFHDTTWVLQLGVGWGGVLVEKAFVRDKMNYFVGGMFGGGRLTLSQSFRSGGLFDVQNFDQHSGSVNAGFLMLEGHGGFTYSVLSWLHIGIDVSAPAFYSPGGFKSPGDISITNSFFSVNPGVKVRLIFGNIG